MPANGRWDLIRRLKIKGILYWESVFGVATRLGLVGRGSNPGKGQEICVFPDTSIPALRPHTTSCSVIGLGFISWG